MARHIYVHNPFCARKCPYCDFYSVTKTSLCEDFYKAAIRETGLLGSVINGISDSGVSFGIDDKDTVYFGGGTPSLPDSLFVCSLLDEIRRTFNIGDDAEITIEVNPSSVSEEKLNDYVKAGFNRISIGIQSLDDSVLKTLGRLHDSRTAVEAVRKIQKAGFTNISADLITGVPGETLEGTKNDIDTFYGLGIKHISTYSLMIEEGTVFYDRYSNNIEDLVPPESERMMYHGVRDHLEDLGYEAYEISNSAFPGYRSIHNSSYWNSCGYLAVGAGAHGYTGNMRYGHKDDVDAYIKEMTTLSLKDYEDFLEGRKSDLDSLYVEEILTREDRMKEVPFLRLRTTEGILLDEFYRQFGVEFEDVFAQAINSNINKGFLERKERTLRLTRSGLDFANIVIEDFL